VTTIARTIYLDPAQAALLSMKLTSGIDNRVNFTFLRQGGAPYNTDPAAQLYLQERSTGRNLMYFAPTTDIANGKAQAFIPAADIADPNGYNLQVLGTIDGEPTVIAKGSASTLMSEAMSMVPADFIDQIDLTLERGDPADLIVNLWTDTMKGQPYDLTDTGTSVSAAIYDQRGGSMIQPFSVTVIGENELRMSLTEAQVDALPDGCWWSLIAAKGGSLTTLAEGNVTVIDPTSAPLPDTDIAMSYLKQDSLVAPATGQIVHANYALDILRVSAYSTGTTPVDYTSVWSLVRPADQITVGATTWAVVGITNTGSYYDVTVTPATQSASSGAVTLHLHRP